MSQARRQDAQYTAPAMKQTRSYPHGERHAFLGLLVLLRAAAVLGQAATVWFVHHALHVHLPLGPMLAVIGLLALSAVLTGLRLRRVRAVGRAEVFGQVALDMLALTALLYFSGGPHNPFVSLYLVLIALPAMALGWREVGALSGLAVALYGLLFGWHRPLPEIHHHGEGVDLHITGMWLAFLLSALLLTVFMGRLAHQLATQRSRLADARERALRDESLLALGTLAAGTAHELNTPLNTMGLLVEDWAEDGRTPDVGELGLLQRELERCRTHVQTLAAIARDGAADRMRREPVVDVVERTLRRWTLLRPGVGIELRVVPAVRPLQVELDATLPQALANLLNNAADAASARGSAAVEVELDHDGAGRVLLHILDRGPGPERSRAVVAGEEAPAHTGLGIGLRISNASIERLGGRVRQFDRPGGGCITEVVLPVAGTTT